MRTVPGSLRRLAAVAGAIALLAGPGCGTEDHVNVFHATFLADGAARDFTTRLGFVNLGGYGITCAQPGSASAANLLDLEVPASVVPGQVCAAGVPGCGLVYLDEAGRRFGGTSSGSTYRLTVTEWPGMGGYARGTFEASLVADGGGVLHVERAEVRCLPLRAEIHICVN
jgi:hypothetical protein